MGTTLVTNSSAIISGALDLLGQDDAPDAGDESEVRAWQLDADQHGERLDKVLAAAIGAFSRNYLKQLIEQGAVERNGQAIVKVSTRLKAGDMMRVSLRPTPQSQAFKPEAMALEVVHADDDLLVIVKPAGLVVHPAPGNWSGTLLNGLLAWDPRQGDLPRAGIVHRLDKDTSGLMLVARTRPSMDALVRMIARRDVQRQYLALAHGRWVGATPRDVHAAIGRDPRNRLRMAVLDAHQTGAKDARTTIEWLDGNEGYCLVRCSLHTGRTHQIRVHMASIGHPLVGDETYGGQCGPVIARQALHAFRLALAHPIGGHALEFAAPLPLDMQQALGETGLRYNPR
ncbi:MAG: RluA family pseudouridine synthase [Rhodoferax sp.]|nr:RluA family pseudouridine synthase [Rhodoferax sp.]MBP9929854.1 RluA family pseudouridine synthase [Rhodoferax sp.]